MHGDNYYRWLFGVMATNDSMGAIKFQGEYTL